MRFEANQPTKYAWLVCKDVCCRGGNRWIYWWQRQEQRLERKEVGQMATQMVTVGEAGRILERHSIAWKPCNKAGYILAELHENDGIVWKTSFDEVKCDTQSLRDWLGY